MNLKHLCLFSIFALLSICVQAQSTTASPYSFYGIGSLKFKGTVENRSMGRLSFLTDSIHINLSNPATYAGHRFSALQDEGQIITYTVGGSRSTADLNSSSSTEQAANTSFDYLAVRFPTGKFGVGFGLMPYTAVGYNLESLNASNELTARYNGEGGLNKVFLGLGYRFSDALRLGVEFQYNFGNLINQGVVFDYDNDGELLQYQSQEYNRSDLSGTSLTLGVHYEKILNEKLNLYAGATYSKNSKLTSLNQRSYSTLRILQASGQGVVVNTITANLSDEGLDQTKLTLPSRSTIGVGIGAPQKWFVGTEIAFSQTSKFSNAFISIDNVSYEDATSYSLGGYFIPKFDSFRKYYRKVTYRAGIYKENTGMNINGSAIDEFGMSFGLGLPVSQFFSNANIGVEFGKRGTTDNNLIEEKFLNLQIGLSLNDRWFVKRRYN